MDALLPYTKSEGIFHAPEPGLGFGYAFNATLSNAKPPKNSEETPLTYDSNNPIRNASDRVTSLPSPGRHQGLNHIAYADGHARPVKMERPGE